METAPITKEELTNDGNEPGKDVFPASHQGKSCGSSGDVNSSESAEGQVSSELLMGARKEVEKREKKQEKGEILELVRAVLT